MRLDLTDVADGVYSRAELLALDYDDPTLRRLVRNGLLTQPRHGWYATSAADPDCVEAARRGGCLSCVSALRAHGFWLPPGYHTLHVRASRHSGTKRQDFCRLPAGPLPVLTSIDAFPVALACAAQCMSAEDWIITADSVLNKSGMTVDELRAEMPQVSKKIENMLAKCDPRSQSGTESAVRLRLRALGFHVEVQPAIVAVGHVDLKVGRLLIECDSKLHHTSLENYRKDRRRDRKSLGQQLLPMRLTYDDVIYGWEETLADIRAITDLDRHRLPRRRKSAS
ncbi:hypothetical protein V1Y59_15105 [Gordonia sp. PKS22-38]|uniref:DUF559 domain-containing protein n=1 Tax=Gordonia prachuapensis TaxID=3115651 RepID=A0ABU7MVZ5_9ACTN|nr:hypothetical protein [Gordonia sp. PKS22-38]